jgi:mutator protein MutT
MTIQIAIAIIAHPVEESILIAKRKADAHLPDLWEFPGGKCLPGESPREAVVREALEETGLEVEAGQGLEPIVFEYPDRTVRLFPFLCTTTSTDARPLGSQEVRWVDRVRLVDYDFPEANEPLIRTLVSR